MASQLTALEFHRTPYDDIVNRANVVRSWAYRPARPVWPSGPNKTRPQQPFRSLEWQFDAMCSTLAPWTRVTPRIPTPSPFLVWPVPSSACQRGRWRDFLVLAFTLRDAFEADDPLVPQAVLVLWRHEHVEWRVALGAPKSLVLNHAFHRTTRDENAPYPPPPQIVRGSGSDALRQRFVTRCVMYAILQRFSLDAARQCCQD